MNTETFVLVWALVVTSCGGGVFIGMFYVMWRWKDKIQSDLDAIIFDDEDDDDDDDFGETRPLVPFDQPKQKSK